ncbi:endonuclease/exonuclease/phosphatase family protein [soil metagenome]
MTFPGMTVSRLVTAGLLLLLLAPLVVGVAALSGIGHRWVDILAQFTAAALVGAVLLAASAAMIRLWPAAVAGTVVSLIVLVAGWPQWLPPTGKPKTGAPIVTLYSANVHKLNRDTEAVRASVADARADVVVLVETPRAMAGQLDRILPGYPYRIVGLHRWSGDGTIIASRWPLKRLPRLGETYMAAAVRTPLGEVTVFGVHLNRPWPYQFQWSQIMQVEELAGSANGMTGPLLLAGDFNSVSSARIGRMIRADLGVIPAPGWPGTWPSSLPSLVGITIDQVYYTPDLAMVGRRVGSRNGSDHRPVVTRFTLSEPKSRP